MTDVTADMQDPPGPIAYLTGEYPKVSHTFIAREIAALRAGGANVITCTVRRPLAKEVVGADQATEAASTFCILEAARSPSRLIVALLGSIRRAPGRWIEALALAWRTRSPGPRAALWQLFYFLEANILAEHLHRNGARHIHNHFGDSSCTVAMLASTMSSIPFSFTPHGPAIFFEPKRWRLDEKVARATFVACISHFARAQTMLFSDQAHWNKLHVIHCGVRPDRYKRHNREQYGKHVIFVGRLAAVKGLPLLLDCVASLRRRHPEMRLTIVGDGPDRPRLEQQSSELGLTDLVRFAGYQSQDAVSELLSASDVFVLPSFAEGVPVVLMEAMASRLPVISSRIAGIPELVDDEVSGLLVPPGDGDALGRALDRLLSDGDLCAKMGCVGREKVEAGFDVTKEAVTLRLHVRGGHAN